MRDPVILLALFLCFSLFASLGDWHGGFPRTTSRPPAFSMLSIRW
jgi:hypothetical protein